MRLVFILYAEDRDLLPSRTDARAGELYESGYSVRGLFGRLTEDAALNPDTMDERRSAWGRLLALANGYAMYDPKSGHITQWQVPVAFAGAYDVQFDEAGYAWGADMSTDLVPRLNVETGEWSSYLLPTSINTRHIDVQKSSDPHVLFSMWTEGQQSSRIVHIEPLAP